MTAHTLDPAAFRAKFPEFADATKYPDATLTVFWNLGAEWLGADDGPLLCGPALQTALDYMAAHLLKLATPATGGGPTVSGAVVQAAIDKVSVTVQAPPAKSEWGWWLASTLYGASLWAFLKLKSAGGFYFGGSPARAGFRGPLGYFGGG